MLGDVFAHTLAAAQRGDEAAFESLWRDLNPALVRYLRVFSGSPSVESVDDVVAETWLQVVRGLRSFSGDEVGWRGWVFTIARHRVFDNSRRARRHREAVERQPQAREQYAADAADAALERLGTVRVLAAIARLPRDAGRGRRAAGAVRVAAHRGLKRLAGAMTDEGVTL